MAGLKPNDFHWIIEGKLAVSECIGGGGLTPHQPLFGNSVGGGMVGLDVESDFDGDSEG